MSNEIVESVAVELERIAGLPVEEQPAAYSQLQQKLQQVLDGKSWSE
ncbi:MAG: hypothetical protein RLZZ380_1229 [Actinomycetota bacterium]|jgi:hypothetical protein